MLLSSITHLEHTSVCSHSWLLLHWWPLRDMAPRKPTGQETLSPFSQERTETCVFPHPMFLSKFFTLVTHLTLNAHLCVKAGLDWDFHPYIYMHTHTQKYYLRQTFSIDASYPCCQGFCFKSSNAVTSLPPKYKVQKGLIEARDSNICTAF